MNEISYSPETPWSPLFVALAFHIEKCGCSGNSQEVTHLSKVARINWREGHTYLLNRHLQLLALRYMAWSASAMCENALVIEESDSEKGELLEEKMKTKQTDTQAQPGIVAIHANVRWAASMEPRELRWRFAWKLRRANDSFIVRTIWSLPRVMIG